MGEVHDYGCSQREVISDLQSRIESLKEDKAHLVKMNGRYLKKMQEQQSKIEQLEREKAEIELKIRRQIDLLESASKSKIAYNERERNILKSQADDLWDILRGES